METGNIIAVGIADIKIGSAPDIIRTTLGSCVAVCLYCQELKVGGMLHFMMAAPSVNETDVVKKAKYAQTGIPELLRFLKNRYGAEPRQFIAKLFGGANLLPMIKNDIGSENDRVAREILKASGVKVYAGATGGNKGYRIDFDVSTGKVMCHIFGQEPKEY